MDPNREPFAERLTRAVQERRSAVCVGLDPRPDRIEPLFPPDVEPAASAAVFCKGIVEAISDIVPAVKPNIAFFEALGVPGIAAYAEVCAHAQQAGLLVIGDVKRGDIGSTAEAYATGLLGPKGARDTLAHHDAVTISPYLGSDGVEPFLTRAAAYHQGIFVLVRTSNPSSAELQGLRVEGDETLADAVAGLVHQWGEPYIGDSGLSPVGAVVGATHPQELSNLRKRMPNAPFLVPGYGAQGGGAQDVVAAFRADGTGALVNASRSVLYAFEKTGTTDFGGAARQAAQEMSREITAALETTS
jgi:orotidine-5'-phosphate decarboxylase